MVVPNRMLMFGIMPFVLPDFVAPRLVCKWMDDSHVDLNLTGDYGIIVQPRGQQKFHFDPSRKALGTQAVLSASKNIDIVADIETAAERFLSNTSSL